MHLFNYFNGINPFSYFGVLSDKQILKYLGYKIFIFPFNEKNLKGSTYNLTASQFAYYVNEKKEQVSVLTEDDKIKFPPYKTVNILTQECIFVEKNFCGTYHTRVSCAKKGLSSISTTLDPMYHGASLISVTNLTDNFIEIDVGDSFASLILYKMYRATGDLHDNQPSRLDISKSSIDEYEYISKDKKNEVNQRLKKFITNEYYLNLRILKKEVRSIKKEIDKEMYRKYNWIIILIIQLVLLIPATIVIVKAMTDNNKATVLLSLIALIISILMSTIKDYINK